MLKPRVEEAINAQIQRELYSSYLYLSMAAHLASRNLPGFSHWLNVQAQEEMIHVIKFYTHVLDRGGKVTLQAIEAPPHEWPTLEAIFQATLAHERYITENIHDLVDIAAAERDHGTHAFLQWYVNEQVEEEKNAEDLLAKIQLLGGTGHGVFMMDRDLAARPAPFPTPPALLPGGAP